MDNVMDPEIVKASVEGNSDYLDQHVQGLLSSICTFLGDTVLHLHVGDKDRLADERFMKKIVDKDPLLLCKRNSDENIPFHVAAKSGQDGAVKFLIERGGGSYIMMVNKEGDTALHIACRERNFLVVKELLFGDHGVHQDHKYTANNNHETPLHIAVDRKADDIVDLLLNHILTSDHGHPAIGCALHEAVSQRNLDYVLKIATKLPALIRFQDRKGQTPLHYAVFHGWAEGVELLLRQDPSAIYCQDNDGRTAAHVAARQNKVREVQLLVDLSEECCAVSDIDGQNSAHYAAKSGRGEIFSYFLKNTSSKFKNLIDKKDDTGGNTPLHLFAESIPIFTSEQVASLRQNKVISLIRERMNSVYNNDHCTPGDIAAKHMHGLYKLQRPNQEFDSVATRSNRNKDLQEVPRRDNVAIEAERVEMASRVAKKVKVFMPISILLAGLSYGAGISVPGGFNQNDNDPVNGGTSILVSKSSFQAFIALNTIAFMASVIEATLYIMIWINHGEGIWTRVFTWASRLTLISVGLLVTAYAVNLRATTWKSEFCTIIVNLLLSFFMLAYGGFVVWAMRHTRIRERSELDNV